MKKRRTKAIHGDLETCSERRRKNECGKLEQDVESSQEGSGAQMLKNVSSFSKGQTTLQPYLH